MALATSLVPSLPRSHAGSLALAGLGCERAEPFVLCGISVVAAVPDGFEELRQGAERDRPFRTGGDELSLVLAGRAPRHIVEDLGLDERTDELAVASAHRVAPTPVGFELL